MANPEHLEILKQGVEVWNEWRKENPEVRPDLYRAHFFKSYPKSFQSINLSGANLSRAIMESKDFKLADFSNANLREARLSGSRLVSAFLRGANLKYAMLGAADFSYADLEGADLRNASIINSVFKDTNLKNANITHSAIEGASFDDVDLSEVNGLSEVNHFGPSTIGVDTLYKSGGKIPEVFLRGCGVPESFIVQIRALVASTEPIQFYTCFISFTEADDSFSERLYNDLQAKGVRCWRWKEDARWGKSLMHSIDEAVRVYDKLIVICSEQSLNAPAVIREIERALQKEDDLARQGKEAEVLFPIRLDDYIFDGWTHHRKADVIAKNVGDFRKWKDHDSYQKAFERLLRDLKAGE